MKTFTNTQFIKSKILAGITIGCLAFGMSANAQAESGASHHSGQASKHSALAVSHTAASTTKVASAVVATPFIVAGGVSVVAGSTVLAVGDSLADTANASSHHSTSHNNHELVITNVVITADQAPNKAIKKVDKQAVHKKTTKITTTEMKKTVVETQ